MKFSKEGKSGEAKITLHDPITVNEVIELRKTILDWLGSNTSILLDLSDVSNCDTSGIQLLFSAKKTAESLNKTFSIISASESVTSVSDLIGFEFNTFK